MRVPEAMIKKWFDFGCLRFIDRMDVDPTLPFVTVARLCKVNWHALGSDDWFPYE